MKKLKIIISFSLLACLFISGCAQPSKTIDNNNDAKGDEFQSWQEQYDLGMHYLSAGKFEEAIIAFTSAIEIDAKQIDAYIGRGWAYMGSGVDTEILSSARADFETALKLDKNAIEAYIGLADALVALGEGEYAIDILRQGIELTDAQELKEKLAELEKEQFSKFRSGPDYTTFFELSIDEQELIKDLTVCVESGDKERAWELLVDLPASLPNQLRTEHGKYRVRISKYVDHRGGTFEIRTKDEVGYCCHYWDEMSSGEYGKGYGSAECKKWNWNGAFTYHQEDNMTFKSDIWDYSGQMLNGLLEGDIEIAHTFTWLEPSPYYPVGVAQEDNQVLTYVNGFFADSDWQQSAFYAYEEEIIDWSD